MTQSHEFYLRQYYGGTGPLRMQSFRWRYRQWERIDRLLARLSRSRDICADEAESIAFRRAFQISDAPHSAVNALRRAWWDTRPSAARGGRVLYSAGKRTWRDATAPNVFEPCPKCGTTEYSCPTFGPKGAA